MTDEAKPKKKPKIKKPKTFCVCKGKAITTKRGILSSCDEIKAEDLAGGQDALDAFLKAGYVVAK